MTKKTFMKSLIEEPKYSTLWVEVQEKAKAFAASHGVSTTTVSLVCFGEPRVFARPTMTTHRYQFLLDLFEDPDMWNDLVAKFRKSQSEGRKKRKVSADKSCAQPRTQTIDRHVIN